MRTSTVVPIATTPSFHHSDHDDDDQYRVAIVLSRCNWNIWDGIITREGGMGMVILLREEFETLMNDFSADETRKDKRGRFCFSPSEKDDIVGKGSAAD